MIQNEKKKSPYPSRLRGRGVDVPKALFYIIKCIIYDCGKRKIITVSFYR
jgi:hypothetical protein